MRESSEEVGHIAVIAKKLVVNLTKFGRDLRAGESADARHGKFPCRRGLCP